MSGRSRYDRVLRRRRWKVGVSRIGTLILEDFFERMIGGSSFVGQTTYVVFPPSLSKEMSSFVSPTISKMSDHRYRRHYSYSDDISRFLRHSSHSFIISLVLTTLLDSFNIPPIPSKCFRYSFNARLILPTFCSFIQHSSCSYDVFRLLLYSF
jgi:hypothetical protein